MDTLKMSNQDQNRQLSYALKIHETRLGELFIIYIVNHLEQFTIFQRKIKLEAQK